MEYKESLIKNLGVTIRESDGTLRSVYDIICYLSKKWGQMSQQNQIEVSEVFEYEI